MRKSIPVVVFLIVLLSAYYFSRQNAAVQNCDCTFIEIMNKETKALQSENKRINALLKHHQREKDSLLSLAKEENKKVIDLRSKQHEKVQAIDDFSSHELLDFFAGLETDSTKNRK